jgi:hypothetical protein
MALSINTLRSEVYKYLNESSASTLGQLPTGTGGTTVTSDAVVKDWILEGINALCRSCVYYPVTATFTLATGGSTVELVTPTTITPTGATIWFPFDTYISSTKLTHASEQSIRANNPDYRTTAAATSAAVLYWYRKDNYSVAVYPYNNTGSSITLTVHGAGTPPAPATDATDSINFLPDDLLKQLIASYAAMMLVLKNTDDPSIAQRAFWSNKYNEGRMALWNRLDPNLRLPYQPFSVPPVQQAS